MTLKEIKRQINHLLKNSILRLSKRQRFVASTFILTAGLLTTQLLPSKDIYPAIAILGITSYVLGVWSLWEELSGIEFLTLLIPPFFYTVGIGSFYFLLPLRWITRLPVAVIYAIGIYAIFLVQNIFNVAAIRTIALLRAAHSVSLLFSLITFFLIVNTIFSFHLYFFINFVIISLFSFILILYELWNQKLTEKITSDILLISIIFSVILGEFAFTLSFWPIKPTFEALYLVSLFYTITAIGQNKMKDIPVKTSLWEYLFLNSTAIFMIIRTSYWGI